MKKLVLIISILIPAIVFAQSDTANVTYKIPDRVIPKWIFTGKPDVWLGMFAGENNFLAVNLSDSSIEIQGDTIAIIHMLLDRLQDQYQKETGYTDMLVHANKIIKKTQGLTGNPATITILNKWIDAYIALQKKYKWGR